MNQGIHKITRRLTFSFTPNPVSGSAAVFLWGARQTGKTTLLRQRFPSATFFDLLDTAMAAALAVRPALLRQRVLAEQPQQVVIDEVQKAPELLEEVHWLLENTSTRFVLCGSSARKLRRHARNLLGGRAVERELCPLTAQEIGVNQLDLRKALNHGTLPVHYLVAEPRPLLRAYVNAYIKEEIIDESVTRNIPAFARFLENASVRHGQQLNYTNVARESGVSASTVRNYYQILEDTLLGFQLQPWRKGRRRMVETAKFYLFDVGVANQLHPEVSQISEGSDLYGRAFEHLMVNEVRAYLGYLEQDRRLTYWRTSSGSEVDLIVGDMELAIEFKSSTKPRVSDLRGLRALRDDHSVRRRILVSRCEQPERTDDGIDLLPWQQFVDRLWGGEIV